MDMGTTIRKAAAGTALVGALGLGAAALGSGVSLADPGNGNGNGHGHGNSANSKGSDEARWPGGGNWDDWNPGNPPGHNPFGPPGRIMHEQTINGLGNPFYNVPPGHWDTVDLNPLDFGIPATITIPGTDVEANVFFNTGTFQWGYLDLGGGFVALSAEALSG